MIYYVKSPRAQLLHIVRSAYTYKTHSGRHVSAHLLCGNAFNNSDLHFQTKIHNKQVICPKCLQKAKEIDFKESKHCKPEVDFTTMGG